MPVRSPGDCVGSAPSPGTFAAESAPDGGSAPPGSLAGPSNPASGFNSAFRLECFLVCVADGPSVSWILYNSIPPGPESTALAIPSSSRSALKTAFRSGFKLRRPVPTVESPRGPSSDRLSCADRTFGRRPRRLRTPRSPDCPPPVRIDALPVDADHRLRAALRRGPHVLEGRGVVGRRGPPRRPRSAGQSARLDRDRHAFGGPPAQGQQGEPARGRVHPA